MMGDIKVNLLASRDQFIPCFSGFSKRKSEEIFHFEASIGHQENID